MGINKYKDLTDTQKQMRLFIIDMIIEKENYITLDYARLNLINKVNFNKYIIDEALRFFEEENIMVVNENKIEYIYPVSAYPTIHKVKLNDNREFNAMCAIDALGCRCIFNQDLEINSMCSVTGEKIKICIKDGNIDYINNKNLRILHVNLEKYDSWSSNC